MNPKSILTAAVLGAALGSVLTHADYYTTTLGSVVPGYSRNDDNSFGPQSLGFDLTLFGTTYNQAYINNNGNITFGVAVGVFTPQPLNTQSFAPMIAPFFADVDTRNSASGLVYVNTSTPDQIIITWDQVGYFSNHVERRNSFQLVLRGPNFVLPAGEGRIGFFYGAMQWETGDASGGVNGFGGIPATAGFGDGLAAINPGEVSLPGSQRDGISRILSGNSYWFDLDSGGTPAIPEPSTYAAMVAMAGVVGVTLWRRRQAKN
jgi:hypothetical protein